MNGKLVLVLVLASLVSFFRLLLLNYTISSFAKKIGNCLTLVMIIGVGIFRFCFDKRQEKVLAERVW